MSAIDLHLERARSQLRRISARALDDAVARGALLIDIRPADNRKFEGRLPGAIVIDRLVLEWRLDPTGAYRISELQDRDQQIILVCNEGYASSLAAATLQELGLPNATDLLGGYRAWRAIQPVREVVTLFAEGVGREGIEPLTEGL